jgi:hypothetical protein
MATDRPAGEIESSVVTLYRMHYGKLAEGEERRVAPSSGYAITRRTQGLDPAWDSHLSPLRLTGLRRFEPDAIDLDARGDGCLVARAIGDSMVFMRARFRPEDGERGFGRLHQQSTIWVGAHDAWRRFPKAFLSLAARELHARPDLVAEAEAERLNDAPLRWRVNRPDPHKVMTLLQRAPWAAPMLETLVEGAETGRDAMHDFGSHDFATEADFLAAVGYALQALPATFPRWSDISVVSGLVSPLPGLCLRYVPSWGRARAAA